MQTFNVAFKVPLVFILLIMISYQADTDIPSLQTKKSCPECQPCVKTECPVQKPCGSASCPVYDCKKYQCPQPMCPKQVCPKQKCPKPACPSKLQFCGQSACPPCTGKRLLISDKTVPASKDLNKIQPLVTDTCPLLTCDFCPMQKKCPTLVKCPYFQCPQLICDDYYCPKQPACAQVSCPKIDCQTIACPLYFCPKALKCPKC